MKKVSYYSLSLVLSCAILSGCSDDTSTAASVNGSSSSSGSLGPSTQTGIITHRDFHILYDNPIPEIFDDEGAYVQTTIVISVHADDINDLNVSGQVINFATEWGKWSGESGDSCVLVDGSCSVSWTSGDPGFAPADCQVSFTAWANGEERFSDENDSGFFDVGEDFSDAYDLEEPFLDINENGIYDDPGCNTDGICEMIDIVNFTGDTPGTTNGIHDPDDGFYNGSLCADVGANPLCTSSATSTMIHTRSVLTIQLPFDHDDDDTTAEVNICN